MKNRINTFLLIVIFSFKLSAQTSPITRAKLKSTYIYNFTRFFEWKNQGTKTEFTIGVLGADTLIKKELDKLALTKKITNLPIRVISFKSIADIIYT